MSQGRMKDIENSEVWIPDMFYFISLPWPHDIGSQCRMREFFLAV